MQLSDININDHQVLFDAIEYNYPSSREDRNTIKQIILNEDNPLFIRAMVISALTLNLLRYFDNEKFESLYTYTLDDQNIVIRVRALVAIILVTMKHDVRISLDEKLVDQLRLILEDFEESPEKSLLVNIQLALYKCTQARLAAKQLKETLGPQIEQGLNIIKEKKNKNAEEIAPEWDNYLEESGIQDQINDLINLQRNGIDIMFNSFAQMSRLPFYLLKCNWFIPFSTEHPLIKAIGKKSEQKDLFIKVMAKSGNMCSTDKYSNVLMLSLMPESQMGQIETAFKANDVNIENIVEAKPEDEIINYLHDLYRYFHISASAKDEYNPFDRSLYFGNYYGLNSIIGNHDAKKRLANFLYKFKIYNDAILPLKDILKVEEKEEYLQKYAYCLINSDSNINASLISDVLTKTNHLYPGNKWTLKNLYKSLVVISAPQKQVEEVLRDGVHAFPEDIYFLNNLASCLIKQEKCDEAMKLLFKSDIIKENSVQTMTLLVECAGKLNKTDIVEKYIKKLKSLGE